MTEEKEMYELTDADVLEATAQIEQTSARAVLERIPRLQGLYAEPEEYLQNTSGIVKINTKALSSGSSSKVELRSVVDYSKIKKDAKMAKEDTAGEKWFDMPKTEMTPQIKRDLQLLKLRHVLDPKRHYRRPDDKAEMKYFQPGTIVEGPTEFFSARLTKKERKQTLADEIMADERAKTYFKNKYEEIQKAKTSGGKRHYKKVLKKRR
ncbi:putative nucleolus protein required for cell viability [Myxozyma melibiosi]|uniref:Nucleolus protein required for cell viability n=1 Tax=Myxozyma melibiosi TaxID=54550 RepID=A0ABR1EY71_9ASCO